MEQEVEAQVPHGSVDQRVNETEAGELLDRLSLIESQPLAHRAQGFEQLHDELVAELQRSDHERA